MNGEPKTPRDMSAAIWGPAPQPAPNGGNTAAVVPAETELPAKLSVPAPVATPQTPFPQPLQGPMPGIPLPMTMPTPPKKPGGGGS